MPTYPRVTDSVQRSRPHKASEAAMTEVVDEPSMRAKKKKPRWVRHARHSCNTDYVKRVMAAHSDCGPLKCGGSVRDTASSGTRKRYKEQMARPCDETLWITEVSPLLQCGHGKDPIKLCGISRYLSAVSCLLFSFLLAVLCVHLSCDRSLGLQRSAVQCRSSFGPQTRTPKPMPTQRARRSRR